MLLPKKVKHRKWQKGRSRKRTVETRGLELSYGSFGLKSTEAAWVNSRQIEAARKTITNYLKRDGRLWIRIFPDKPITLQAPEKTLGGGKGSVDHYVFPVKPGRVLVRDRRSHARARQGGVASGLVQTSGKNPRHREIILLL